MLDAITPENLTWFLHGDTYGIAISGLRSIPTVSDTPREGPYPYAMRKNTDWLDWGDRLRAHVREQKISWTSIASALDQHESGIRHWCNGTRDINLVDFFRLCGAAGADPQAILFGEPLVTEEQKRQLGEAVISVLGQNTLSPLPVPQRAAGGRRARRQ